MRPLPATLRGALAAAALAIAVLAPAAVAQAPAAPSVRFAVGSPALEAAQAIARAHWGVDPCGGDVAIAWVPLERYVNALSSWTVQASDAYAAPELNRDCRIDLSTRMAFAWPKLCTVVVHEYGHLAGRRHDDAPGRLMSAVYERPIPECLPQAQRRATASLRRASSRRAG